MTFTKQDIGNGLSDVISIAGIYGNVQDGRPMGNFGLHRVIVIVVVIVVVVGGIWMIPHHVFVCEKEGKRHDGLTNV
jgi:hypothetical protein